MRTNMTLYTDIRAGIESNLIVHSVEASAALAREEREREGGKEDRSMAVLWLVVLLAGVACVAQGKEEEFSVYSTLRRSSFSVNLRKFGMRMMYNLQTCL